jgi:hypothetical protein
VQEERLARVVLWTSALAFVGPGLGFLLAPDRMAALLDLGLASATARSDVRAVMGGLEVALGVCLAACALGGHRLRQGLVLQLALFGGLVAGRLVGLGRDGGPGLVAWLLFGVEIALLALGVLATVNLWAAARGEAKPSRVIG